MRVPLMLEMAGHRVICVGAGPVAASKVVPLLDAGADVTVVAPEVDARLIPAAQVHRRPYERGDLDGTPRPRLVVAATGVPAVDDRVATDAASEGIWCLRIDGGGDVAVPSVIRRGGVTVALSTGVPALTKRLRQVVEAVVDDRWATASTVLTRLRGDGAVQTSLAAAAPDARKHRWHRAVDALLDPSQVSVDHVAAILRGRERDQG